MKERLMNMGFYLHKTDDNRVPGFEVLPCTDDKVKIGMAVNMIMGTAVPALADSKPSYIAVSAPKDGFVQAIRVLPDMVFETVSANDFSSAGIGANAKLTTGGEDIETADGSGRGEIVYIAGDGKPGSTIRVRFC
ncbi:MAG: hypothetical protein ACI4RV_00085 [Eubacteriales bacterium]